MRGKVPRVLRQRPSSVGCRNSSFRNMSHIWTPPFRYRAEDYLNSALMINFYLLCKITISWSISVLLHSPVYLLCCVSASVACVFGNSNWLWISIWWRNCNNWIYKKNIFWNTELIRNHDSSNLVWHAVMAIIFDFSEMKSGCAQGRGCREALTSTRCCCSEVGCPARER